MMDLVRLYIAGSEMEAQLLEEELRRRGIRSVVMGGPLAAARGELPLTTQTQPALWVDSADAERAVAALREVRTAPPVDDAAAAWQCPRCGEHVEPHFTMCWSCMAERPDVEESGGDVADVSDEARTEELPCVRCGYDLRTLPIAGRCPECGSPILRSLLNSGPDNAQWTQLLAACAQAGRSCRRPATAVMMVAQAWLGAYEKANWDRDADRADADGDRRVSAEELCTALRDAFRAHAGDTFDEARLLTAWRLGTAAEVGQVVDALIAAGVLHKDTIDPPDAWGAISAPREAPEPGASPDPTRQRMWLALLLTATLLAAAVLGRQLVRGEWIWPW